MADKSIRDDEIEQLILYILTTQEEKKTFEEKGLEDSIKAIKKKN